VKFRLKALTLRLKRETVEIAFSDVSYFWGQMAQVKQVLRDYLTIASGAASSFHQLFKANLFQRR
jgi:hypothetical protein